MKEVLILGDLHLERLQSTFRNWVDWSFAPLKQVEKYAIKNNIQHVIQTGDCFDSSSPDQATLTLLIDFLAKSPLKWYFISGNHDKSSKNQNSLTILRYLSQKQGLANCKFFIKPTKCKVNGITTVFLPWPHTKSKLLPKKPAMVIAHIERKGARYDNGLPVDGHNFDLGQHFWVLGHLHEAQQQDNGVFVGAPLQLRNGDSLNKHFLHVKYKNNKFTYQEVPIKLPYRLLTIKIKRLSDQRWQRQLSNLKKTDYVRLLINKQINLPQKYLNHQQVLTHDYVGKAAKQVISEVGQAIEQFAATKRMETLDVFLSKMGLSAAQRERARQIATNYEAKLNL